MSWLIERPVLTQGQLADALSGRAVASPNALAEAAQRVATGDMRHAVALLPGIGGQSVLTQAYDSVFRMLLQILVAVTLASALVILGCEAALSFLRESVLI